MGPVRMIPYAPGRGLRRNNYISPLKLASELRCARKDRGRGGIRLGINPNLLHNSLGRLGRTAGPLLFAIGNSFSGL